MSGSCIQLRSPLASDSFPQRGLEPNGRFQSTRELIAADCLRFNAYLEKHPQTLYRLYTSDGGRAPDYAFLDALPALRELWLEAKAGDLIDLTPLRQLPPALRVLTLDTVMAYSDPKLDRPKTNIDALARLERLEELTLCGRLRDLGFLAGLARLEKLSLWRTKLNTLNGIEHCRSLKELKLVSSGAKSLGPIGELAALERLELERHSIDRHLAMKRSPSGCSGRRCAEAPGLQKLRTKQAPPPTMRTLRTVPPMP